MKRILQKTLLAIACLLCSIVASAHDFEVDGIYYYITSETDKTVEVTYGEINCKYTGSVVIPETVTYNGTTYSVTSIGDYAFGYCDGLTSVTIPESITSIGYLAFDGCTGLTSITIPNSVTSISKGAFNDCSKLTEIVVKEGNTVYDSRENCNAIIETATNKLRVGCENTIIPNNVTSIGDYAFYGCTGLTSVTIPNNVTLIGDFAFYGCTGLTSVTIPESVTSIGVFAFDGCTGLTSITIPNGVTSIGRRAFFGCTGLTSVTIPNNVTSIGDFAFYGCTGLTSVTIPESVTSIGDYAFEGCDGLTSITIPNSVTSIGKRAFYGCTGLTSVTIGNSVTSIGDLAFCDCYSIKDVYAYPTVPPTIYDNTFTSYNATLHTAKGYKDVYAEAPYWEYFTNITDDLTSVEGVKADEAFSVTVVGGTLAITGAADDAVVNIYNTNGALLHNTTVAGAADIALPNGIYLVQVNGVTKKVVL